MEFKPHLVLDPFSLLIINKYGVIKKIHCPFFARSRIPDSLTFNNQVYIVDMVKKESNNKIFLIINGESFSHQEFEILIN